MSDEAHLPAEQSRPRTAARVPDPDGNRRGPCSDSCASRPRPQETVRLTSISKRADFLAANSARRAATPGFVLLVRQRDDGSNAMRIGITVTKKIGNAVVRNRIKRRFRALAREMLPQFGRAGADHVMIGRSGSDVRDYGALRDDLAKALERTAK